MLLEDLATELLAHIFLSCSSLSDVINLAHTCRHLHHVFTSRRLQILSQAAEADYGPLQDAFQLVTHNASQPAHVLRSVPLSEILLKQVVQAGRVAKRWEAIYPLKKWKHTFEDRRLLAPSEGRALRRALYRYWLYATAFHNASHGRYTRLQAPVVRERAELLHNWSNDELAEIEDLRQVLRDVLRHDICPSNGTIQRQFHKRFPGTSHQLLFNVHLNYPPPPSPAFALQHQQYQHNLYHHHLYPPSSPQQLPQDKNHSKLRPTRFHEPGGEGWGDDIQHYYTIEDMMKLSPAQILNLKEHTTRKSQVLEYMKEWGGEWFDNNGETFGQTLEFVLAERGEDAVEFTETIEDGLAGIVGKV